MGCRLEWNRFYHDTESKRLAVLLNVDPVEEWGISKDLDGDFEAFAVFVKLIDWLTNLEHHIALSRMLGVGFRMMRIA